MTDQPPARSLVRLTEPECLEFAATMPVGRLAYVAHDRISVIPVNYLLEGRDVLASTTPDGDLIPPPGGTPSPPSRSTTSSPVPQRMERAHPGTAGGGNRRRSVRSVLDGGLRPWALGAREHVVRLVGVEVTGRRIEPGQGGIIFYPS